MEDERDRQTSRGAPRFFLIVSAARTLPLVCQVHIYQQAGLKEIDDETIEKLK